MNTTEKLARADRLRAKAQDLRPLVSEALGDSVQTVRVGRKLGLTENETWASAAVGIGDALGLDTDTADGALLAGALAEAAIQLADVG